MTRADHDPFLEDLIGDFQAYQKKLLGFSGPNALSCEPFFGESGEGTGDMVSEQPDEKPREEGLLSRSRNDPKFQSYSSEAAHFR